MFLRTDGGLRSIGVCRGEFLAQGTPYLVTIVRQVHVILLIHGLQLGVETTNHHVLETVGLNLGPVFYLVRRNILRIAGDVVRGEGIGTLGTDSSHQFVVLIGNEILGGNL